MVKVAVVGYGVIGQRLADGVALQEDMELVGIADVAPTRGIRTGGLRTCCKSIRYPATKPSI